MHGYAHRAGSSYYRASRLPQDPPVLRQSSNEISRSRRDPSVIDQEISRQNHSRRMPRDPSAVNEPHIELSSRQLALLARRKAMAEDPPVAATNLPPPESNEVVQTHSRLQQIPPNKTQATPTTTSSHKQQHEQSSRALLRTLLHQRSHESSTQKKNFSSAKEQLLKNVLGKQQQRKEEPTMAQKMRQRLERAQQLQQGSFDAKARYEAERFKMNATTDHQKSRKLEEEEDECDADYQDFVNVLKNEVSGQHSQLWESFSAVCQDRTPQFSMERSKGSSRKFDAPTKQLLLEMNLRLKENHFVECVGASQLTNDKKFVAQMNKLMKDSGSSTTTSTSSHTTTESRQQHTPIKTNRTRTLASSATKPSVRRVPSSYVSSLHMEAPSTGADQRSVTSHSTIMDPILLARSSESEQSTPRRPTSPIEKRPQPMPPRVEEEKDNPALHEEEKKEEVEVTLTQFMQKVDDHHGTANSSVESWSSVGNRSATKKAVTHFLPKTPSNESADSFSDRLKQLKKSVKSKPQPPTEKSPAFLQIRLRKVPSPEESSTSSSVPVTTPRGVQRKEEESSFFTPNQQDEALAEDPQSVKSRYDLISETELKAVHTMQTTETESTVSAPAVDGQNIAPIDLTQMQGVATEAPIDLTNAGETQAAIDLTQVDSFSRSTSSVVAVRLRLEPGQTELQRVVVSKEEVMTQLTDANSTVLWKLPRSQVQSLSLDMATCQATLNVTPNATKTLSFGSTEDCLRFANAMYEVSFSSSSVSTNPADIPILVGEGNDTDSATEVSLLDQLSKEEQKWLETFRELRKTKSAELAMKESLPTDGSLTPTENEVAEKYRGMLRMSFPLAVVKEKMARDEVDERIVAAITSEAVSKPPDTVNPLPSSPISTFSASTNLSAADQETVASYKKMLKMKIPVEAVKHKMIKDNVDEKIVDAVLDQERLAPVAVETILTEEEQVLVESYKKMMKLSFPEEVIRHKMKKDQAPSNVVEAVFGMQEKTIETKASIKTPDLSIPEMVIASKYKKMLSLGVDPDGVRHKMTKDDVDSKIVDYVLGDVKPLQDAAPLPRKQKTALSPEEEAVASQFRKLIKLQIPRDSILSRMQQEGVSEKIVIAVLGPRVGAAKKQDPKAGRTDAAGSKLVALHWTPLSGKELDESVWSRASKKRTDPDLETAGPAGSDITKLIHLFQKKTKAMGVRGKKTDDSAKANEKAKLLDLTRSNNVAISLKAFKEFSFKDLADIIHFLDPCRRIRGERVQFIRDLLPTVSEAKVIKEYIGSDDRLVPAELWFRHVVPIKRVEVKAQVLRTMEMFASEADMLMTSFQLLTDVCQQVVQSEKLQDLLEMILSVGNIMNEGTRTGGASGFKFDSLLRLTQTKSSDGRTTVLDFVVNMFASKGQRDTLNLAEDMPEIQTASRMLVMDLTKEVSELGNALKQCETELKALEKENALPLPESTGISDARSNLLNALKSRSTGEAPSTPAPSVLAQREKFLSKLKERKAAATPAEKPKEKDLVLSSQKEEGTNTLESGIERLREFINSETEMFERLKIKKDAALEACRAVAKYCGESGGVGAAVPLLGILSQFSSSLTDALAKYDRQQSASRRSQRNSAKGDQDSRPSKSTSDPAASKDTTDKKSLVFMVNELLKDANDRTKEDFKKGRSYQNPSKRLKEIYDMEKQFVSKDSAEKDIVATIRGREAKVNNADVEDAKSKFAGVSPDTNSNEGRKSTNGFTVSSLQKKLFNSEKTFEVNASPSMRSSLSPLPDTDKPDRQLTPQVKTESPEPAVRSVSEAVKFLNEQPSEVPDAIQKLGSSPLTYSPPRPTGSHRTSLSPPIIHHSERKTVPCLIPVEHSTPKAEHNDSKQSPPMLPDLFEHQKSPESRDVVRSMVKPNELRNSLRDSSSGTDSNSKPLLKKSPVTMQNQSAEGPSPKHDSEESRLTNTATDSTRSVLVRVEENAVEAHPADELINEKPEVKKTEQAVLFDLVRRMSQEKNFGQGKGRMKVPDKDSLGKKPQLLVATGVKESEASTPSETATYTETKSTAQQSQLEVEVSTEMNNSKATEKSWESGSFRPGNESNQPSGRPSSTRAGMSTVARLAQLRREEKSLKAKLSSQQATPSSVASETPGSKDSLMDRARRQRMDRSKTS